MKGEVQSAMRERGDVDMYKDGEGRCVHGGRREMCTGRVKEEIILTALVAGTNRKAGTKRPYCPMSSPNNPFS